MINDPRTPRDEMMEELRAIRNKIAEKTEGMTEDEEIRWFHEGAVRFAAEMGYDMIPSDTHPSAYKLVRKTTDK